MYTLSRGYENRLFSSAWLVVALYDSKGAAFLGCRYYGLLLYQWKDNFS